MHEKKKERVLRTFYLKASRPSATFFVLRKDFVMNIFWGFLEFVEFTFVLET